MATYDEYPIRCETCNEQIACHVEAFEVLLQAGYTKEDALNELGITAWCSRIAMTHPTTVFYNMEDRQVIEGLIDVKDAQEETSKVESHSRPVFNPCIGAGNLAPATMMAQPRVVATPVIGVPPTTPAIGQPPKTLLIQPTAKTAAVPGLLVQPTGKTTVVPELKPAVEEAGIPVAQAPLRVQMPFVDPVQVGFPTINSDSSLKEQRVYVGANKYTIVLDGRTFLCR